MFSSHSTICLDDSNLNIQDCDILILCTEMHLSL